MMRLLFYFSIILFFSAGLIADAESAEVFQNAEEATTTEAVATTTPTISAEESLRLRLEEKNKQIDELEKEIAGFEKEIDKTGKEAATLSNQIRATNAAISVLSSDIKLTKKRIEATELKLEDLEGTIVAKEKQINGFQLSLGELLRAIHERESQTLVEILLAHPSLTAFFGDIEDSEKVSGTLKNELNELHVVKAELAEEVDARESQRRALVGFRNQLTDRKSIEESAKREKDALLRVTKNKEAVYQVGLDEREKQRAELEAEIYAIETELQKLIDPNSLPPARSGILSWPIVGALLTQNFGNTLEAKILYGGKPHNGIDIRARSGTLVLAAEDGEVWETGNTDTFSRCLSYGKWVLVRHANNLATLYAHLSLIKVSKGDTVKRGEPIAYSGYTGYTVPSGPAGAHLHFTVYDAATVRFSASNIRTSTCQFLPFGGYLNPLAYL